AYGCRHEAGSPSRGCHWGRARVPGSLHRCRYHNNVYLSMSMGRHLESEKNGLGRPNATILTTKTSPPAAPRDDARKCPFRHRVTQSAPSQFGLPATINRSQAIWLIREIGRVAPPRARATVLARTIAKAPAHLNGEPHSLFRQFD